MQKNSSLKFLREEASKLGLRSLFKLLEHHSLQVKQGWNEKKTKVARNTTVTWNMSHEYIIIDSISYQFLTCTIKKKHRENSIMIMDTKILIKMRIDIRWKEKEMATSSKSLSWRIPYTEEPGVVQSRGS